MSYFFSPQVIVDWQAFSADVWPWACVTMLFIINQYLAMYRFKRDILQMQSDNKKEINALIENLNYHNERMAQQNARIEGYIKKLGLDK